MSVIVAERNRFLNVFRQCGKEVSMRTLIVSVCFALLMAALPGAAAAQPGSNACWGQASRVFAQMGAMGEHSSSFDTPRLGLRNLARSLYDAGTIPDDSMQALGTFVAEALGLRIDACQ
jgi:hypothetical protein